MHLFYTQVKKVRLPWDAGKQCISGYAYVSFSSASDVRMALSLNGAVMGDRNLVVSVAASASTRTIGEGAATSMGDVLFRGTHEPQLVAVGSRFGTME